MTDIGTRLARIEARQAIGQLPIRYAIAVDTRNLDDWVDLFVPDVDMGRHGRGREALRAYIEPQLRWFYRSIHQICGHAFDFSDADHASGHVYCRAEHEEAGCWIVMAICYFDDYVRKDGRWYFARRREKHWYAADVLERPSAPFNAWPGRDLPPALPAAFPSWASFWSRLGEGHIDRLTDLPAPAARGPDRD